MHRLNIYLSMFSAYSDTCSFKRCGYLTDCSRHARMRRLTDLNFNWNLNNICQAGKLSLMWRLFFFFFLLHKFHASRFDKYQAQLQDLQLWRFSSTMYAMHCWRLIWSIFVRPSGNSKCATKCYFLKCRRQDRNDW